MLDINCSPEIDLTKTLDILREIRADKMAGWVDLPWKTTPEEIERIKNAAAEIQKTSEILVCIGIGGSYLGHRAIIETLRPQNGVKVVYAGNSLSKRELDFALEEVGDKDFSVNVISKSGTTLEPAVAFEAFKNKLIEKYGETEAAKRIYATTDGEKGTLHDEAVEKNYTRFVVPDDIGGRYSVLSPVGLLPLAAAGVNIAELLAGTARMSAIFSDEKLENGVANEEIENYHDVLLAEPAVKYAWARYELAEKGYDMEVFASFEPATMYFNEWLKQLFGESEGKNKQGVFPASVIYSTDLHSLGQFMQDGRRNLWETIIDYPTDRLNEKVVEAVKKAHPMGGIPVLSVSVSSYDEAGFGELIYFFEMACALSAKLFGVNPFDQPGVEAYKAELKKLL